MPRLIEHHRPLTEYGIRYPFGFKVVYRSGVEEFGFLRKEDYERALADTRAALAPAGVTEDEAP